MWDATYTFHVSQQIISSWTTFLSYSSRGHMNMRQDISSVLVLSLSYSIFTNHKFHIHVSTTNRKSRMFLLCSGLAYWPRAPRNMSIEFLAAKVLYLRDGEIPKIGRLVGFPAAVQQRRSGTEHVITVQNGQKSRGHGMQEGVRFSNPYQTTCIIS